MDSTFGSIPPGAAELAIVGDHQYLRVAWVMRRAVGGQLDYYCPCDAWESMPAAQIVARDARIADLSARVAELEELLAERASAEPASAQPAPAHVVKERPGARRMVAGAFGRAQCPHCHAKPWPNALSHHIKTHHPDQPLPDTSLPAQAPAVDVPIPPESPIIVDGDPAWRCADCKSAAFARSLTEPAYCMKCASAHAATNGHAVA